jgi:hypothetical protein
MSLLMATIGVARLLQSRKTNKILAVNCHLNLLMFDEKNIDRFSGVVKQERLSRGS